MTDGGQPIDRVTISLPCSVPVVPGTGDASAPIEQRTERCAIDGWWIVGRAPICTRHLREVMGFEFDVMVATAGITLMTREVEAMHDWSTAPRYDQALADPGWGPALNDGELLRRMRDRN